MRRFLVPLLSLLVLTAPASFAKDPTVELSLKDTSGKKVRLSDYRGKVVVLNFWATWCSACKAEMRMMVEVERKYASKDVVFVAASLDDSKTKTQIPAFVQQYGVPFPVWSGGSFYDLDRLKMGPALPAT